MANRIVKAAQLVHGELSESEAKAFEQTRNAEHEIREVREIRSAFQRAGENVTLQESQVDVIMAKLPRKSAKMEVSFIERFFAPRLVGAFGIVTIVVLMIGGNQLGTEPIVNPYVRSLEPSEIEVIRFFTGLGGFITIGVLLVVSVIASRLKRHVLTALLCIIALGLLAARFEFQNFFAK